MRREIIQARVDAAESARLAEGVEVDPIKVEQPSKRRAKISGNVAADVLSPWARRQRTTPQREMYRRAAKARRETMR